MNYFFSSMFSQNGTFQLFFNFYFAPKLSRKLFFKFLPKNIAQKLTENTKKLSKITMFLGNVPASIYVTLSVGE